MPNIYKINVSPKPLTSLTAVLTFTDDSTSTRTDWTEADTYYTITETTTKTLRSLTVSANNYITQTLETSDLDIDITLSPNIKYVSKIKNNGVVYTLKDESIDGKVEGLANKTLSNVSSIDNNSAVATALNGKQATLVSGTNIKTVNNTSLLGSGNISVGTVTSVNNTAPVNGDVTISIPTVNNATLTIQKNGTTVNTFTANSSSDVTANITVPTAVTDLSDASNYVTNTGLSTILDDYATEQWTQQQASSLYTSIQGWVNNQGYAVSANLADVATTGDYDDLLNKPTIPQAQIQSDWNQTDSSAVDFIKNKPTIPSGVIVDQVYDGTSANAQSGVAIEGELANYVKGQNGDITISNNGTEASIMYVYEEEGTPQQAYGITLGDTSEGEGVFLVSVDQAEQKGYAVGVVPNGFGIEDILNNRGALLSVSSSGNLAVNGSEVALSTDIPTKISDLTDDTATNPVDKADTLTNLTATVAELNYTDGVTSNIQTQFNTITGKIPSQASTSNQLADKAFVNSSVQTATANFRGNWDTWALVPTSASSYPADYAGSTTPTVNDYLVVQDASDYTGDTLEGTWRFKYTGVWSTDGKSGWIPEYQVNETPLTSAQLAALNSGITSGDVTLIGTALQPSDITNMVTTDTDQNITGTKTFVGSKKIAFKQSGTSDKLGFTLYNNSGTEKGYLEYNPSNTVDSVPLMTLGNYATASGGLTHVGFRKYSSISGANGAYNLLAPLISDAKTPFSLTTTYTNFYLPLGFTDGTTTVKTAKSGMVDISSLLPDVSNFVTNSSLATTLSSYATQTWVGNQGYLTSASLSTLTDVTLSNPTQGQNLTYDATTGKWKNTSTSAAVAWGGITGTLADQTDLNTALSGKQTTLVSGTNIKTINSTSLLGNGDIEVLQNTANHNKSLCIYGTLVSGMGSYEYGTAVGYLTKAGVYSNAFGYNAKATGSWAEAFGGNCTASGNWSVVIGHNNVASGNYSTALGSNAETTATRAIQLGEGTNSTASSLQIGFGTNKNYTLLDGTTGLIPDARISSNIARTSDIPSITIDQTYDSTSANAQSGVAIAGELVNYVPTSYGNIGFDYDGDELSGGSHWRYHDTTEDYGIEIDTEGHIFISYKYNSNETAGIGLSSNYIGLLADSITVGNYNNSVGLTVSNSNKLLVDNEPIATEDWVTDQEYATETWVGQQGYITGITSSDVTTALGYTPQTQLVSGTNIKTINSTSLLGSGNIDTSEIFVAEYDVTTFQQVSDAYNAGKTIKCEYLLNTNILTYYLVLYNSSYFVFMSEKAIYQSDDIQYAFLKLDSGDNWTNWKKENANTTLSNVSSISNSSAVATALASKVNTSDIWYDSTTSTLYIGVAQS